MRFLILLRDLPAGFLIFLIRLYRMCISPLIPPCCRFQPTCSQYGMDAIRIHGAFKGSLLTIWRVLRCNPFCRGGFDPVPPKHSSTRSDSFSGSGQKKVSCK